MLNFIRGPLNLRGGPGEQNEQGFLKNKWRLLPIAGSYSQQHMGLNLSEVEIDTNSAW